MNTDAKVFNKIPPIHFNTTSKVLYAMKKWYLFLIYKNDWIDKIQLLKYTTLAE
jgi:hypothetical protein